MNYPKISIITPSFNQGLFIERTIQSVINQNYPNIEYIIIDGGSSDDSVEIIKKYADSISYWISEPDTGQSNAINKGINRATGQFVTWLNSDDILLPNTLHSLAATHAKYPNCNWFAGNCVWIDKEDKILKIRKGESWNNFLIRSGILNIYGPTSFFKKDLWESYGEINEDFHYKMDTEFWWRLVTNGEKYIRLNFYCWGLRLHENAKMSGHNFTLSQFSDKGHPSWKKKEIETQFIFNNYLKSKNPMPLVEQIIKLTSKNYLNGLLDNIIYNNRKLKYLTK